jgi:peptide/nickel transport system permease protein
MTGARRLGVAIITALVLTAAGGSFLVPRNPGQQFADFSYAPPMPPHLFDDTWQWHGPFFYPVHLVGRLEHRFEEDRSRPIPIAWTSRTRSTASGISESPWLPLGADALGRDIFARVVLGARLSLGLALVGAVGALLLGSAVGATAGFAGGRVDELLMGAASLVLVLPAIYVVMVLRGAMPLVLTTSQVFWTLAAVLALAGWPYPARGVRAIVARERGLEYAEAARALGAGPARILLRHLFPATWAHLAVQLTLLLPAFILTEATLSFVGFGFAEPTPSWGVMLQDAAQAGVLADAPWLLAPAAAIVLSVLSLHLVAERPPSTPATRVSTR